MSKLMEPLCGDPVAWMTFFYNSFEDICLLGMAVDAPLVVTTIWYHWKREINHHNHVIFLIKIWYTLMFLSESPIAVDLICRRARILVFLRRPHRHFPSHEVKVKCALIFQYKKKNVLIICFIFHKRKTIRCYVKEK